MSLAGQLWIDKQHLALILYEQGDNIRVLILCGFNNYEDDAGTIRCWMKRYVSDCDHSQLRLA